MGFGVYFRGEHALVSNTGSLCMAAEYLLDLHFAFRFLLVTGWAKIKEGLEGFLCVDIDQRSYLDCYAGKQSPVRCFIPNRDSHDFDDSIRTYFQKSTAICGNRDQLWLVCINEKCK